MAVYIKDKNRNKNLHPHSKLLPNTNVSKHGFQRRKSNKSTEDVSTVVMTLKPQAAESDDRNFSIAREIETFIQIFSEPNRLILYNCERNDGYIAACMKMSNVLLTKLNKAGFGRESIRDAVFKYSCFLVMDDKVLVHSSDSKMLFRSVKEEMFSSGRKVNIKLDYPPKVHSKPVSMNKNKSLGKCLIARSDRNILETEKDGNDVNPLYREENIPDNLRHAQETHNAGHTDLTPSNSYTVPQAHPLEGRFESESRYPEYKEEERRLQTYPTWPRRKPTALELVKAGFFFTNKSDLVRCFHCGIGLRDFSDSDNPRDEHVRHSGNCEFLVKLFHGRYELGRFKQKLIAQDPENTRQAQLPKLRESRRVDDHVRCFVCDGGLRKWDPEDNPWIEHCHWFPACPYARQQKAIDYVELVQVSADADFQIEMEAQGGDMENEHSAIANSLVRLTLADETFINGKKSELTEMGFSTDCIDQALNELRQQGTTRPELDVIIDYINVIQARQQKQEKPLEPQDDELLENDRLKSMLMCMLCHKNLANILFLPCAHHKLCTTCATDVSKCPVCNHHVRQKIQTIMVSKQ